MEEISEMEKKTAETSEKRKSRGICYFLLSLLEDKEYEHVQWTNKEKGEFQIHWVHASSGAWEMDTDAETFRLWAMAKGKLKGRENKNKTWKANFRCAMKSRPELKEIKLAKDSPQRKKNLKFWKFVDVNIVKEYRDGKSFEWRHPRTKSLIKKSPRVQPLRSSQNKSTVETKEENGTSHSFSESRTFSLDERQRIDDDEDDEDKDNKDTYGAGLLQIMDGHAEDRDSDEKNIPFDGRLQFDMDDENEFSSYRAGLLKIIEQSEEDNSRPTVLNIPTESYDRCEEDNKNTILNTHITSDGISSVGSVATSDFRQQENTSFLPIGQQSLCHQMPSAFCGQQTFSDTKITTKNWQLFMDAHLEEALKEEGMTTNRFEACNEGQLYDDFPLALRYIYNQL